MHMKGTIHDILDLYGRVENHLDFKRLTSLGNNMTSDAEAIEKTFFRRDTNSTGALPNPHNTIPQQMSKFGLQKNANTFRVN
jgi:hypothetical protein